MIIQTAQRLAGISEYYFVKRLEEIRRLRAEGHKVINLGIGSPDMYPGDDVVDALSAVARIETVHGYQPYKGIPELREAMSGFYTRTYNVHLDPATEVLPLMGSKEGILHVSMAFLNPGDKVLIPNPGYPTYTSLTHICGGIPVPYNLNAENGWYPNFEEIEQQDLHDVKIMWLNYPHMPTGTPARLDIFEKAIAFAKKHSILLCHDNPYSLVLNKNTPLSIFNVEGAKDVCIELNSLSKSHNMAGWRVGMMLGKREYINAALTVKSNIDSGTFIGIQHAAIKALQQDDAWHSSRNEEYFQRRELIFTLLDKLGFEYSRDQEGMFVWAKPKSSNPIDDISAYTDALMYDKKIVFTPGFIFGSNGAPYMRASLCVSISEIQEAIQRLT